MTPMLKLLVQPIGEKNVGIKLKKVLLNTAFKCYLLIFNANRSKNRNCKSVKKKVDNCPIQ